VNCLPLEPYVKVLTVWRAYPVRSGACCRSRLHRSGDRYVSASRPMACHCVPRKKVRGTRQRQSVYATDFKTKPCSAHRRMGWAERPAGYWAACLTASYGAARPAAGRDTEWLEPTCHMSFDCKFRWPGGLQPPFAFGLEQWSKCRLRHQQRLRRSRRRFGEWCAGHYAPR
jgi:hypothetical protein